MTYENAVSLKKFMGCIIAFEQSPYMAKIKQMNRREGFKICKNHIGCIAGCCLSEDFVLDVHLGDDTFLSIRVIYKVTGSYVFMTDFEFHSDSRHKL